MTAVNVLRSRVLGLGRDLWRAIGGGPDRPPPMLRGWNRPDPLQLSVLAVLLVLVGLVLFGSRFEYLRLSMGGIWWPIVMLLSALLVVVGLRRPLLAWRLAWLAALYEILLVGVGGLLPDVFPPVFLTEIQVGTFLVVLFLAAASQPRGVAFWVWLLTCGLGLVVPLRWALETEALIMRMVVWSEELPSWRSLLVTGVVVVTVTVLAGQLAWARSGAEQRLAVAEEHGLVLAERARIARELHDVVAHHMSMIAVRAETAPYRLATVEAAAREEFQQISQESRTALTEMRRLLGVLRDDAPAPPTTPQPGLTDLADLLEGARAAGATVTVEMHGAMSGLPSAVDVCAYRIVQEALTNATRHAAGAPVHVRLRRTGTELSLSVRNGPGSPSAPRAAAGHGVRGMRERTAMLGGTLQAGPTPDGGFEVSATLPLGEPRS